MYRYVFMLKGGTKTMTGYGSDEFNALLNAFLTSNTPLHNRSYSAWDILEKTEVKQLKDVTPCVDVFNRLFKEDKKSFADCVAELRRDYTEKTILDALCVSFKEVFWS